MESVTKNALGIIIGNKDIIVLTELFMKLEFIKLYSN